MLGLGFMLMIAGGISVLVGLVLLFVGLVEENKPKMRRGAIVLVIGAVGLMVSFSLCSRVG